MKTFRCLLLALGFLLAACNLSEAAAPTLPSATSDSLQFTNTLTLAPAPNASLTSTSTIPEPTATPTASQTATKTRLPSSTPTRTIVPSMTPTLNLHAPGYLLAYRDETGIGISNSEGYGSAQVFSTSSYIMNFFWAPEGDSLYVVTEEKLYQVIINLANPAQSTVTEINWGDDIVWLYSATPSPNGAWVALVYSRWDGGGVPSMRFLNLSNGKTVDITFAGVGVDELVGVEFSNRPWSSDSQQIAFTAIYYQTENNQVVSESADVFVANIDGTIKKLTQYENVEIQPNLSSPVWAPGKKALYFYLTKDSETGIFKLSSQGGQAAQVVSQNINCSGKIIGPILSGCFDISTDGNWLFFEGFDENLQVQPTFLQLQTLETFSPPTETYLFFQTYAVWSPTGSVALLPCMGVNSSRTQLCVFDLSESDVKLITPDSEAQVGRNPVWSPDGKQIVFEDNDLFVMHSDGSNLHALATAGMFFSVPTWSPVPVSALVE